MAGVIQRGLAGDPKSVAVAPLVSLHAARLEQVPETSVFSNADVAARALRSAQALYNLDVVYTSTVDSVAWALRSGSAPGHPIEKLIADHRNAAPIPGIGSVDVGESVVTAHVHNVLEQMKALLPQNVDVGVVIPTAEALSQAVGGAITVDEADEVCGAFLRTVGASEPDLVLRIGGGERGNIATGTCGFFGIPLVEFGDETTDGVAVFDPHGEESPQEDSWLYITAEEISANVEAQAMHAALNKLRATS